MSYRPWLLASLCLVACSSAAEPASSTSSDAGSKSTSEDASAKALAEAEADAGSATVHGTMVDVESLAALQALTVTGGGSSATTDANGNWSITVPIGTMLQGSVTGDSYSQVDFPDFTPLQSDVDLGTIVIPTTSTYNLEQDILTGFDPTKALVHVIVATEPTCASAVGGTVTVTSPSGASVAYFGTTPVPSSSVSSFQSVANGRPVAVIYNIDPSATLSVAISHPTCKQAAFPMTYDGRQYPGSVPLAAAQSGVNSALMFVLE